jgi:plasmid maintenance system killer protein
MIRSFRDKALERFFATGDGRRLSVQNTRRIANILRSLDDASRPEDGFDTTGKSLFRLSEIEAFVQPCLKKYFKIVVAH